MKLRLVASLILLVSFYAINAISLKKIKAKTGQAWNCHPGCKKFCLPSCKRSCCAVGAPDYTPSQFPQVVNYQASMPAPPPLPPACPSTCPSTCYPHCDAGCCSGANLNAPPPSSYSYGGPIIFPPAQGLPQSQFQPPIYNPALHPPGIQYPTNPYTGYPDPYNACLGGCPATCQPACTKACCSQTLVLNKRPAYTSRNDEQPPKSQDKPSHTTTESEPEDDSEEGYDYEEEDLSKPKPKIEVNIVQHKRARKHKDVPAKKYKDGSICVPKCQNLCVPACNFECCLPTHKFHDAKPAPKPKLKPKPKIRPVASPQPVRFPKMDRQAEQKPDDLSQTPQPPCGVQSPCATSSPYLSPYPQPAAQYGLPYPTSPPACPATCPQSCYPQCTPSCCQPAFPQSQPFPQPIAAAPSSGGSPGLAPLGNSHPVTTCPAPNCPNACAPSCSHSCCAGLLPSTWDKRTLKRGYWK